MFFIYIIFVNAVFVSCDECGPLGYGATTLLSPAYWFFDLTESCPILPEDHHFGNKTVDDKNCRIYFNLCKSQTYQCSGAVCARYTNTIDFVSLLGEYESDVHPFSEVVKLDNGEIIPFQAKYTGEKLLCGSSLKPVKTVFSFLCDKEAVWNISIESHHGGSRSMQPQNVTFDQDTCEFNVIFKSSEACVHLAPGETAAKGLSYGSLILILFFPGLALYFILGTLFNCTRGASGQNAIPHREFWLDLPDLIMDGFIFTMATITCKHEDRFSKEYDSVP